MTTTLEPGFHRGRVDDRAQPRQHAAGDQRGAVERHILWDRNRLRLVDDHVLGEGAGAQTVDDRLAGAVVQRGGAVEREHFLAEHRRALGAGGAEAAIADERRDHGVADFEPRDPRTDRLDHARRLVAVDGGQFAPPGAVDEENVAVADRAGRGPDQDLARPRLGELDRLDRERRAEGAADGGFGFHGRPGRAANSDEPKSGSRREFKRSLEGSGDNFCGPARAARPREPSVQDPRGPPAGWLLDVGW